MRRADEQARRLAPVNSRLAERAWRYYLSGEGTERGLAEDAFDILLHHAVKQDYRHRVILPPPPPRVLDGPYHVGTVVYPPGEPYARFGLQEHEWPRHLLITGMTGAGKTTLAGHLLRELARHDKPFLVLDWKQHYRTLNIKGVRVYRAGGEGDFRFNPLLPPLGTPPGEWLMHLVDVLKHAYFVGEGVEYLLRHALDQTYQHCGWYDQPTATPTFFRVKEFLYQRRTTGRVSLWHASAKRVLDSLCFRHGLGPTLNNNGIIAPLLNGPVVLELDALADSDKTFLAEALILWLYHHRKHEKASEEFVHALVLEEAHHVLNEQKERQHGAETIMETCLRQIREYGQALIAIDQEPHKLSNSIKANTNTKITFNLGNGKDIRDMSTSQALTPSEEASIQQLKTGEAIITTKGRNERPIHVRFPLQ